MTDFPPRLMPAPLAARYIGVSETTLRGLGLPRRVLGGRRFYDKADLDAFADGLAYDCAANECDQLFGGWKI